MSYVMNPKLSEELQKLEASARVEMYILHLSTLGPGIPDFYFHSGLNELSQPLVWQGVVYEPYPAQATGFARDGQGAAVRPTLTVANIQGTFTGLAGSYNDLVGVPFTRVRTLKRFLDAVNFADGNPEADDTAEFPRDTYSIDQKTMENKVQMQFTLRSVLDVEGEELPARQIIRSTCTWQYRKDGCFYSGPPVADENDIIVTDASRDRCSKRMTGCKLRFGENGILNISTVPSLSLL